MRLGGALSFNHTLSAFFFFVFLFFFGNLWVDFAFGGFFFLHGIHSELKISWRFCGDEGWKMPLPLGRELLGQLEFRLGRGKGRELAKSLSINSYSISQIISIHNYLGRHYLIMR